MGDPEFFFVEHRFQLIFLISIEFRIECPLSFLAKLEGGEEETFQTHRGTEMRVKCKKTLQAGRFPCFPSSSFGVVLLLSRLPSGSGSFFPLPSFWVVVLSLLAPFGWSCFALPSSGWRCFFFFLLCRWCCFPTFFGMTRPSPVMLPCPIFIDERK